MGIEDHNREDFDSSTDAPAKSRNLYFASKQVRLLSFVSECID